MRLVIDLIFTRVHEEKHASILLFFRFVFMTFTPTKTSRSQRDELFAKSDFHESIRLTTEVLYLRNSESCTPSRSVYLARGAKYTQRSLRAATRFSKQIGSYVVINKRYPKRASEKRRSYASYASFASFASFASSNPSCTFFSSVRVSLN